MTAKRKVRKPLHPPLFYFLFFMNFPAHIHVWYLRILLRSLQSKTKKGIHQNVTSREYENFKFVLTFPFFKMSTLNENTQEKHT